MKRGIWKSMAAGAIAIAAAVQGAMAAPASFAYQGVIHELDGNVPEKKNRVIEFRIYDGPETPNILWGRAYNVLLDENGLFNAPLADDTGSDIDGVTGTGLAQVLAKNAGTTLYVGLTVDGSSGEISPRQAILAVPYAIQAADAAGASGDFPVTGELTAVGLKVTGPAELASVEVASLSVAGKVEITGGDGVFTGPGTVPVGGIILWSGSADSIPEGWALCNGQTNNNIVTPNLSGQFVVGFDPSNGDYNTVGKMGGAAAVTLTTDQMPAHTHDRNVITVGYDALWDGYREAMSFANNWQDGGKGTQNNGVTNIGASAVSGGGQAHENRPPYYVVCYIMRVK